MASLVGGSVVKAIVFDTETTGLIRNRTLKLEQQPEIIEFYGAEVNLKTGKILAEIDTLIKPSKPLSEKPNPGDKKTITEITGITNEMLADAPTIKDVAPNIFRFLSKGPILIAHNASFDKEMLELEAQRLNLSIKFPRFLCTVEQTISLKGYRLTLSNLHQELFNEPFAGAHRAKVDVAALIRCCKELFKRGVL